MRVFLKYSEKPIPWNALNLLEKYAGLRLRNSATSFSDMLFLKFSAIYLEALIISASIFLCECVI